MKFNRELFIEETAGNLGAALDMIDGLVEMINGYCYDDETATLNGFGTYGEAPMAEKQLLSTVQDDLLGEFLEPTLGR